MLSQYSHGIYIFAAYLSCFIIILINIFFIIYKNKKLKKNNKS